MPLSSTSDAAFRLRDTRTSLDTASADQLVSEIAARLTATDLGISRRFAICAANSAENILAMTGGLLAGTSSVPVSAQLTVEELAYILEDSGAQLLFVGPETRDVGLRAAAAAGLTAVVGWRCEGTAGLTSWEDWLEGEAGTIDTDRKALAQLHYTSGTTGRPKGTETPPQLLPAGGSVKEMFAVLAERASTLSGPAMIVGPLNHTGPLSSLRQFAGGRPLVVMERFSPEAFLQMVEDHQIAGAVMVPTHFQRLLALPEETRSRFDLSSLRDVVHTGSRCPIEVKHAMIDWFGPIFTEGYGATEIGATNYISSAEWLAKPGSVGRTNPPFEPLIVDDGGCEVGPGIEGRIFFNDTAGRGVIFPNDPAKTRAAHLRPGVFTLGDRGYLDDDGYLFVTGRSSDMVISGGVNIYPAEIERVLSEHPDVADVAAIGIAHADLGEQLIALVVARDLSHPPDVDVLTQFAAERLARYKLPRAYRFLASLGRTDMGKLNKAALAKSIGET